MKLGEIKIFGILFSIVMMFYISINAYAEEKAKASSSSDSSKIVITKEMEKKYPLKEIHKSLSLECIFCHEGQGKKAEDFEAPEEETCLTCHKNKDYLQARLSFMDTLKASPHNSVHDGHNLACDECHNEHKPSVNMCLECHEKEIKKNMWMRKTP